MNTKLLIYHDVNSNSVLGDRIKSVTAIPPGITEHAGYVWCWDTGMCKKAK